MKKQVNYRCDDSFFKNLERLTDELNQHAQYTNGETLYTPARVLEETIAEKLALVEANSKDSATSDRVSRLVDIKFENLTSDLKEQITTQSTLITKLYKLIDILVEIMINKPKYSNNQQLINKVLNENSIVTQYIDKNYLNNQISDEDESDVAVENNNAKAIEFDEDENIINIDDEEVDTIVDKDELYILKNQDIKKS